ncbi:MAG: hypothetical protein ACRECQ_04685, partial [Burkholderiaceae bacterium]
ALAGQLAEGAEPLAVVWQLAVLIPAGVAIYVSGVAVLWLAAGKPTGAETMLLSRLADATSRFRPASD